MTECADSYVSRCDTSFRCLEEADESEQIYEEINSRAREAQRKDRVFDCVEAEERNELLDTREVESLTSACEGI